jgi:hypothetical protein
MAEIITGRIIGIDPDGFTVRVPFRDWERFTARAYDEVLMELPDTRRRSPEQLRKAWAIMGDMALYLSGDKRCAEEDVYQPMRAVFAAEHQKTLQKRLYHLSESSMTEARDFISFLLDQCMEMDIPLSRPAAELTDDIQHYVYQCTLHRKCAVCGRKAELHHVDRVGMGRNRQEIDHEGMRALPLCREHHHEAHEHGDAALMTKYHLEPILIDRRIIEKLKIGRTA